MKALLSLRVTVDHDDRHTPIFSNLKLYREDDVLIWRLDGEYGNECETLPRPRSAREAKLDARQVYADRAVWKPKASWF